ncbi:MAG: DUF2911 domain-containing protein [Planctomycetes bacterium]|nr:DUF2911 domain-containing protein [Planctomycetota bacterium]
MLKSHVRTLTVLLTFALGAALPAQEPATAKKSHGAAVAAGRAALQESDWQAAAASFKKAVELDPEDGTSWQLLGYSLHADGRLDEALPIHQKAAEFAGVAPVASYNVACVYALKGDKDKALTWLEKAAAVGFDRPEHIANDPDMDPLRADPRFAAALAKIEANGGPDRVQVYAPTTKRECARVAWFGRTGSPGQIAIDYSPIPWRSKYDEMVDSPEMIGKKWRLGSDFWTSLDTSVALRFGDVTVPAGYYYLTLAQPEAGRFELGVHDAATVRKQKLDAYLANRVQGGIAIALAHGEAEDAAETLALGIELAKGSQDHGEFTIRFGGHVLSAPVLIELPKAKNKTAKDSGGDHAK